MSIDWRTFGDVPLAVWQTTIRAAGGPELLAAESSWQAAKPHSALALAMLRAESNYATDFNLNRPENLNPLNLRPPSGGGYMSYPSYPAALRAWRERITSPDYKGGVYARTTTIADLIRVYAPSSDNNNEAGYVRTIETLFNKWGVSGTSGPATPNPGGTPMPDLVFGRVPYPAVVESHLSEPNPYLVMSGAPNDANVEAVFWHRMIGSWHGTNTWFHGGNAATAYGVSVAATDGVGGKIFEWMARNSGAYGESSGPANGPYGDGAKLIAKVGVNSVNRTTKAIEISGNYDTPLDEAARKAIVALTAYFADRREIPWTEFPNVPGEDRSFVCWHNEITGLAYKQCPGSVVMAETPALIQRVKDLLRTHQEGVSAPAPTQYAKPILPPWWEDQLGKTYPTDQSDGSAKVYVMQRNFVATEETRRLDRAGGRNAKRTGPNLKAGEKIHGERLRSDGFVITVDGHYVSMNKLSPRVRIG